MSQIDRHHQILALLRRKKNRGATPHEIADETGASKATVYRDLRTLASYHPLHSVNVNGEARWKLDEGGAGTLAASERDALGLALAALSSLEGTSVHRALAGLLRGHRAVEGRPARVDLRDFPPRPDPVVNARLDEAIRKKRRVCVLYQGADDDDPRERVVEPAMLKARQGVTYVDAYDVGAGGWRTFKLSRLSDLRLLDEAAQHLASYDAAKLGAASIGVWEGPAVDVVVRVIADAARFVGEWPLSPEQVVEPEEGGSVLVHARVAGTVEAMRWVLRWGRGAEVVAPPSFRAEVAAELEAAGARYRVVSWGETGGRQDGRSRRRREP